MLFLCIITGELCLFHFPFPDAPTADGGTIVFYQFLSKSMSKGIHNHRANRDPQKSSLKIGSNICAKCVNPKVTRVVVNKFNLIIPMNISSNDTSLQVINIHEFNVMYSKIRVGENLLSALCNNKMFEQDTNNDTIDQINIPNLWRTKDKGKLIQHVPIKLYSDDTSGNASKHWNKHISFYFPLLGLTPNLSNEEFHCHFLATSN